MLGCNFGEGRRGRKEEEGGEHFPSPSDRRKEKKNLLLQWEEGRTWHGRHGYLPFSLCKYVYISLFSITFPQNPTSNMLPRSSRRNRDCSFHCKALIPFLPEDRDRVSLKSSSRARTQPYGKKACTQGETGGGGRRKGENKW